MGIVFDHYKVAQMLLFPICVPYSLVRYTLLENQICGHYPCKQVPGAWANILLAAEVDHVLPVVLK
jgi:hypothetical protein